MPASHQTAPDQRPRLGISACLTGLPVRYDGTDKRSGAFFAHIAPYVELYPLCPESAIGMPTPRPPIDLIQTADGIVAQGKADPTLNPTQSLQDLAKRIAEQPLDGFILTQRSPSCGLGSTKVYQHGHLVHARGTGIFAAELSHRRPDLLLIEDDALADPACCFALLCGLHIHQRLPGDQPAARRLQQDLGYLIAGYSAEAWQQLEALSQQDKVSDYREQLQLALKRWLENPISVDLWLQQVHHHLQSQHNQSQDNQSQHKKETEIPLSLADLGNWLSHIASNQTPPPRPLPFFKDWRVVSVEDNCENLDAVR